MKNDKKYESTDCRVCFRNLGALLQGVKDRVLCELIKKHCEYEEKRSDDRLLPPCRAG
jgi:hypothetical protein